MTSRLCSVSRRRRIELALTASVAAAIALPTGAPAATNTFENPTPITIPAAGTTGGAASPYPSAINVSGFSGPVEDVEVSIQNLNYTCPADVMLLLVGPGGERTILLSDSGGDCSPPASNTTVTFDDEAAFLYPCNATPSGIFKPTESPGSGPTCFEDPNDFPPPAPAPPYPVALSVFYGTDPNGDWKLYVADEFTGDFGNIANGWSLTITAETLPPAKAARILTLDANKNKVKKGKRVTLSGRVTEIVRQGPCESGQTVELQRKRPKQTTFTTVEQLQTDAAGSFSTKEKVKKTFEYRAQVAETAACGPGLSNAEKVKVKKKKK